MRSKGNKRRVKRPKAAQCDGKTQYPSEAAAELKRRDYIGKGTDPNGVKVYHCPFCKYFHVGRIWRADLRQVKNRARHWK